MSVWVADDAVIYGNVTLGEDCSVYYHSVIRAESGEENGQEEKAGR